MAKIKITPLAIILITLEIVLFIYAFYFLIIDSNNGNALGGSIALIAVFINTILFFVQQMFSNLKGINTRVLWTIEILIIIFGILYISIHGKSIG